MQILKKSDLRPYFIFIAPCSIAKLKEMRQHQGVTVTVCIVLNRVLSKFIYRLVEIMACCPVNVGCKVDPSAIPYKL